MGFLRGLSDRLIQKEMTDTRKGRIVRKGSLEVFKRLVKMIPIVGPVFSLGFAGHEIKKKGLLPGAVHVALDVTPVVGTAKNVVEIFTGDWIPDKTSKDQAAQQRAEPAEELSPGQAKRSPG
jgi:hypothetical protein